MRVLMYLSAISKHIPVGGIVTTSTQLRPLALLASEHWVTGTSCSPAAVRQDKKLCFSCAPAVQWVGHHNGTNDAVNSLLSLSVLFHLTVRFPVFTSRNYLIQPHPSVSPITSQFLSLLSHPDSLSQFHQSPWWHHLKFPWPCSF